MQAHLDEFLVSPTALGCFLNLLRAQTGLPPHIPAFLQYGSTLSLLIVLYLDYPPRQTAFSLVLVFSLEPGEAGVLS